MKRLIPLAFLVSAALGCGGSGEHEFPAPSNLAASLLSGGVHLTWMDNSTDETGFEIERKDPGGQFVKAYSVTFDISQYHDAQVTTGSTYSYRVRGVAGEHPSSYSNEVSIQVK